MEVSISPDAADLIRKKGGQVVVFLGMASGCCTAGGVPLLMVEPGPPRRAPENYEVRQVDGVAVYLARETAALGGRAEINLRRGLWSTGLSIKHVEIAKGGGR